MRFQNSLNAAHLTEERMIELLVPEVNPAFVMRSLRYAVLTRRKDGLSKSPSAAFEDATAHRPLLDQERKQPAPARGFIPLGLNLGQQLARTADAGTRGADAFFGAAATDSGTRPAPADTDGRAATADPDSR
ncbi:MAG TPA: hypothetical protein VMU52_03875, partial [Steroidobacteraceae bacterium]|nr:hypothetical protein [Steroidobacteraceae bacterium]